MWLRHGTGKSRTSLLRRVLAQGTRLGHWPGAGTRHLTRQAGAALTFRGGVAGNAVMQQTPPVYQTLAGLVG